MKIIERLFKKQEEAINFFFNHIDLQEVERFLQPLLDCKGTLVFAGIGKSGIIAKKIAMTLISTGSKALYLSAVDMLHGDLGVLSENDIFITLSKSGESEELLNSLPFVRNKGASVFGILCDPTSRLANACDQSLCLPLQQELCPFGLAPTTSAALQLIFGDIIAVAMMESRKFTLDDYAKNHPAGSIGKKMTFKVKDLMLTGTQLPKAGPEEKLAEVLAELSDKRCGCVVVTDPQDALLGIFTDGDLRRVLQTAGAQAMQMSLREMMTQSPRTIDVAAPAWDAMKQMEANQKHPITVLPVIESDKVVGVIKMHDILQAGL